MVSGFFTSPCDHSRIFSGLASEMRIALNESGSFGFSKKLKMSFTVSPSDPLLMPAARDGLGPPALRHRDLDVVRVGRRHLLRPRLPPVAVAPVGPALPVALDDRELVGGLPEARGVALDVLAAQAVVDDRGLRAGAILRRLGRQLLL